MVPRRLLATAAIGIASLVVGFVLIGQGSDPGGPARPSSADRTGSTTQTPGPTERGCALALDACALASAYLEIADAHNAAATNLLIANPLAEWDLVGVPLAALVQATSVQVGSLPEEPAANGDIESLRAAIATTGGLLDAIDPHAPRVEQAMAFQAALDDWVTRVQPIAAGLRLQLELPAMPGGDLQL